ncbi:MAG: sterol desaturase family protein [Myxococcota bacterium]
MKASPESPRLFENNFLDFFSRSPWWTVPLFWLPVCGYLIYQGPKDWSLFLIPLGFFIWGLTEYLLHRFIFHMEFEGKLGKRFHFLMHGVHHEWPNDRFRLVMPLLVALLIAVPFALFYHWFWGPELFCPFFAGFLLGYVEYECTHYAVHHVKSKHPVFMRLKRHHLLHHHSDSHAGTKFGVSSPLWDKIFKTR